MIDTLLSFPAIVLAIGGKYLGWEGVLGIFLLTMLIIAVAGKLLTRRYVKAGPGMIQAIPAYALPQWKRLLATTWERTSDILTIVTPLLVLGSVALNIWTLLRPPGIHAFGEQGLLVSAASGPSAGPMGSDSAIASSWYGKSASVSDSRSTGTPLWAVPSRSPK